jgi:hypothetical protein
MGVERIGVDDESEVPRDAMAHPRWRRRLAYCLVAAAVVAIAVLVLANWNPRRYVALMPLAGPNPAMTAAVALAVLIGFVVLLAAPAGRRTNMLAVALMSLTLPTLCAWGGAAGFGLNDDEPVYSATAARSPDGRWQIVVRTFTGTSTDYYDEFRLQSRAGWRSRESPRPLAVIRGYSSNATANLEVVSIAFPSANTIALSTNDGQAYTTSFNPATLATADEFGMCDGVPPRLCP